MRIIINPKYQKHKAFIQDLNKNFDTTGNTIYSGRNVIKTFQVDDIIFNVKSFKVPHFINKIAYAWLRGSKAKHSYEYGMEILKRGARTPEPVAILEVLKNGLFDRSYYVSLHHQYNFTIRDLIGFDFPDKENILRQFAIFTFEKLHKNGIHHLDYSRGNILISKNANKKYDFSIVDINRLKFEKIDYHKGLKNFSQIWANEDELEIIARTYACINQKNEQQAVEMLFKFDREHKEQINRKLEFKNKIKRRIS